jgi:hypothetical protein
MLTEDLTFYHGTGAAAARAILVSGSRESLFEEIGAYALGRQVRRALLTHAKLAPNEDWLLHSVFIEADSENLVLGVSALRQLDDPDERSHFAYGHFFVTLNIGNAYRYTIGNPYRSEFILALAESLKVLDHVGHPLPHRVATCFPEIHRIIKNPSSPVVLELRGICRERLLTEKGGHDIDAELQCFIDMGRFPGLSAPAAFRVRDVTAADIVAVHDLRDWPSDEVHDGVWRPDQSKVAAARRSVEHWLAEASAA